MPTFPDYIKQRLRANGYSCVQINANDVRAAIGDHIAWICYLEKPITVEYIQKALQFSGHLLFVLDDALIPDAVGVGRIETPMWLRVLHGLYYGRIYCWSVKQSKLYGVHFDYKTGEVMESPPFSANDLIFYEQDSLLRALPGIYRLARFTDPIWWETESKSRKQETPKTDYTQYSTGNPGWQTYDTPWSSREQAEAYEKRRQDLEEELRKAWERMYEDLHKNQWTPPNNEPPKYTYGGTGRQRNAWDEKRERGRTAPPPQQPPPGAKRDFLDEFVRCGSLKNAKALYRQLLREFHPDMSGADVGQMSDAEKQKRTAITQQINVAWDKAQRRLG